MALMSREIFCNILPDILIYEDACSNCKMMMIIIIITIIIIMMTIIIIIIIIMIVIKINH